MSAAMHARFSMYALLWRTATRHAGPPSRIVFWGMLLLVSLTGLAIAYTESWRAGLVFGWCAACAGVLLSWTWRFVPGAVKLASPANAALVPQMRRRLVELACLAWFVPVAGIALAPYADPGPVGLWLFLIVFGTVGSAFGMAGHQAGSPIITVACLGSIFVGKVPAATHVLLSSPPALALALLLYAGLIVAAAREMFPQGGERHWGMIARRARIGMAASQSDPMIEKLAGVHTKGWYAAALRRDGEGRDSRRLVLHALGPVHHLGESMVALGLVSAVLVVLAVFTTWRTDGDVVRDIGWMFTCLLLVVPFAQSLRLNALLQAHPAEQALVRLAPAMPGGAPAFNRHLGQALVRQALLVWAIASGAALALTALGGAGGTALLNLACACCLLLPLAAAPLRNHAQRAALANWMAVILLLVSAAMDLMLGYAARRAGLPVLPVAAVLSIVTAAIAVTRGLRVMQTSPFAFPAGRTV